MKAFDLIGAASCLRYEHVDDLSPAPRALDASFATLLRFHNHEGPGGAPALRRQLFRHLAELEAHSLR